ncbi:AraC family transcriptional regulator [Horticoccus luteus]|uniref:AraC family transcriptional regulator n=1 Tax=Horticoccus luteus TaxID=2862869 RepID=A0A8F9XM37_9BACT|nr:AraC family transcriptional regulator [Horticoccus luteus]QYM79856.1 AraC family transcriptional regulator [Horticoccus luteus]
MSVSRPIPVELPPHGVAFVESVHGPRFHMAERIDPFHKIIYVLHGRIACSIKGDATPVHAPAGTVVCVAAGVGHKITDSEPATLLLLCFSRDFVRSVPGLDSLWEKLTPARPAALRPGRTWAQQFETYWRAAVVEQAGVRLGREIVIRAAAENALVALARRPAGLSSDAARRRVETVARELAATFYEPWSLERACAQADLSRRQFSKLFREVTDRSFLAELTERRLTHAAQLLRAQRHSVVGAAFSSGYGDLSHFYRLFRARFGHPPRAWLEKRPDAALPR